MLGLHVVDLVYCSMKRSEACVAEVQGDGVEVPRVDHQDHGKTSRGLLSAGYHGI